MIRLHNQEQVSTQTQKFQSVVEASALPEIRILAHPPLKVLVPTTDAA